MSRSGYSDNLDKWDRIRWRGQVASAIRGKRGQKFLADLFGALEAMPEKILISGDLQDEEGSVCAIGALGVARGIDMSKLDPDEPKQVAEAFGIAHQLAQEVAYENDEGYYDETCEHRYERMKERVQELILEAK